MTAPRSTPGGWRGSRGDRPMTGAVGGTRGSAPTSARYHSRPSSAAAAWASSTARPTRACGAVALKLIAPSCADAECSANASCASRGSPPRSTTPTSSRLRGRRGRRRALHRDALRRGPDLRVIDRRRAALDAARPWRSPARSPLRSTPRTRRDSSTATSSPPTSWSCRPGRRSPDHAYLTDFGLTKPGAPRPALPGRQLRGHARLRRARADRGARGRRPNGRSALACIALQLPLGPGALPARERRGRHLRAPPRWAPSVPNSSRTCRHDADIALGRGMAKAGVRPLAPAARHLSPPCATRSGSRRRAGRGPQAVDRRPARARRRGWHPRYRASCGRRRALGSWRSRCADGQSIVRAIAGVRRVLLTAPGAGWLDA